MSFYDQLGAADNLNDPTPIINTKGAIYGVVLSLFLASTFCGLGRLYTRCYITRNSGKDDALVALALVVNAVLSISTVIVTDYGLGGHFILLGDSGMSSFLRALYVPNASYPTAAAVIKLALLFQCLRIWPRNTKLGKVIIFMIIIVTLWGLAFSFISWVPCIPVSGYWDFTGLDTTIRYGYGTHNLATFIQTFVAQAASNMAFNIIVFAIPMFVWCEHDIEKNKSRWGLAMLFILGACTIVTAIVRVASIVTTKVATYPTLDPSWYGCEAIVLSTVEINLATICASLPVFWPVLTELQLNEIFVTHEVKVSHESVTNMQHLRGSSDDIRSSSDLESCGLALSSKDSSGSTRKSQLREVVVRLEEGMPIYPPNVMPGDWDRKRQAALDDAANGNPEKAMMMIRNGASAATADHSFKCEVEGAAPPVVRSGNWSAPTINVTSTDSGGSIGQSAVGRISSGSLKNPLAVHGKKTSRETLIPR